MKTEKDQSCEAIQEVRIVLVTFPNLETARQIGTLLVKSQLAACLNLVPGVESIYWWENRVNRDNEIIGIIKTTHSCLSELEQTLITEHPYDVPEFLVFRPDSGFSEYLEWVMNSCREIS